MRFKVPMPIPHCNSSLIKEHIATPLSTLIIPGFDCQNHYIVLAAEVKSVFRSFSPVEKFHIYIYMLNQLQNSVASGVVKAGGHSLPCCLAVGILRPRQPFLPFLFLLSFFHHQHPPPFFFVRLEALSMGVA